MPETIVNTTAMETNGEPVVTKLASGGWVVVWQSAANSGDLAGQLFDAQGARLGGEFGVNATTAGMQYSPVAGALPGGGFVVTWIDGTNNGTVRFQRFDAAGARSGAEIVLGTSAAGYKSDADISVASDGSYVISWTSAQIINQVQQTTQWLSRYDAAGNKIGNDLNFPALLNTDADWVALSDGHFAVAYGTGDQARAAFVDVDASGVHFGQSFQLNDPETQFGRIGDLSLVRLADGNLAAAWVGWDSGSGYVFTYGASSRVFGTGGAIGVEASVTNTSPNLADLRLGALAGGGYAVSWTERVAGENNVYASMARAFDNAGDGTGGAFQVNLSAVRSVAAASIAGLDAGHMLAVLPGTQNVLLQVLDVPGRQAGTANGDTLTGTASPDDIRGLDGNDTIDGGAGSDELYGGNGADNLTGGAGHDLLAGDAGADQLSGGDGNDRIYAAQAAPEIPYHVSIAQGMDHGQEVDTLSGGAGDDQLFAGVGDNVDGGAGTDTLYLTVTAATAGVQANFAQPGSFVVAGGAIGGIELLGWFDGSAFDDVVVGGAAGEISDFFPDVYGTIHGNGGNDRLTAGFYTSNVYGDAGNDVLNGSDSGDLLIGGTGADTIDGGAGADFLSSADGTGSFSYYGFADGPVDMSMFDHGSEIDTLSGGAGDDAVIVGWGDNADGGTNDSGGDVLVISLIGAGAGVTANFALASQMFGGGTITGFERVDGVEGSNFGDNISFGSAEYTPEGGPRGWQNVIAQGGDDMVAAGYYTQFMDGGDGDDILDGRASQYLNYVVGGAGNDTLYLSGKSPSVAHGGDGNDTVNAIYGSVFGDAGNDRIVFTLGVTNVFADGGAGDDEIRAGSGSGGIFAGGAGADYLVGGIATDFLYSGETATNSNGQTVAAPDVGAEHDRIEADGGNDIVAIGYGDDADGGTGSDSLQVWLTGAASGVTLSTGSFTGATPFSLGGGTIQGFEALTALVATEFDDFITVTAQTGTLSVNGGGGNDVLVATTGATTLLGGAGNDWLFSGSAIDTLDGGAGIDIADFSALSAGITVQLAASASTLVTASNGDRLRGIENLYGTAFADTLRGNGDANVLRGGAGADSLDGGAGADDLDGGTGADQMRGGIGDDIFHADQIDDLVFENAGEGTDTVIATGDYYLYANIENLTLAAGAGDIFGVGNDLQNAIAGNEGANLLLGGGGGDVIHGNAGNDQLYGEDGADQLFGDAGIDYLIGGAGNDVLDGGGDEDALYGEGGDDILWGGADFRTDIFIAGDGDDILHGDSGLGDYDLMDGGAGNDAYYVDTGADQTFEAADGGTDTVYANVGAGQGVYLYANVENLVLLGTSFFGVGNALANAVTGNASVNWLLGGAGDDVIDGRGGNDVLYGEAGADRFVFQAGSGADFIGDFVAGTDRIDLSAFGFTSFAQVQAILSESGGSTAIQLSATDLVVLYGVSSAALHAGDFVLSGGSAGVEADPAGGRWGMVHQLDAPGHLVPGYDLASHSL